MQAAPGEVTAAPPKYASHSTVHPSAVQNLDSEINRTGAFPLNGNAENPYIQGANNVISAYKKMLRSLMPSYPTYFQDILRLAIA